MAERSQCVGIEEMFFLLRWLPVFAMATTLRWLGALGAALIGWSIFRGALYSLRDYLDRTQAISESCFDRRHLLKGAAVQLRG